MIFGTLDNEQLSALATTSKHLCSIVFYEVLRRAKLLGSTIMYLQDLPQFAAIGHLLRTTVALPKFLFAHFDKDAAVADRQMAFLERFFLRLTHRSCQAEELPTVDIILATPPGETFKHLIDAISVSGCDRLTFESPPFPCFEGGRGVTWAAQTSPVRSLSLAGSLLFTRPWSGWTNTVFEARSITSLTLTIDNFTVGQWKWHLGRITLPDLAFFYVGGTIPQLAMNSFLDRHNQIRRLTIERETLPADAPPTLASAIRPALPSVERLSVPDVYASRMLSATNAPYLKKLSITLGADKRHGFDAAAVADALSRIAFHPVLHRVEMKVPSDGSTGQLLAAYASRRLIVHNVNKLKFTTAEYFRPFHTGFMVRIYLPRIQSS